MATPKMSPFQNVNSQNVNCQNVNVLDYGTLVSLHYSPVRYRVYPAVGRKRRGTAPARYVKASASVHRHVLQQLEKMKLIEQDEGK